MTKGTVCIITGKDPARLVDLAAQELKIYLLRLFGISAEIKTGTAQAGTDENILFILAPPEKLHGSYRSRWTGEMPILSDQGFLIKQVSGKTAWLIGGSPVATLWAVYELAENWGIVYSLQGDVFPSGSAGLVLPDKYDVFEPRQKIRSWRLMNALMTGAECWSLEQQKKVICQLVKQKYNGLHLNLWVHHPYVNFMIDGITKKTPSFNFGIPIPVTKDNIGLEHLRGSDLFINPEFIHCRTPEEWYKTGADYANSLIDHAKSFDMDISSAFQPFDYSKEFAPLLEKPVPVTQLGDLFITEGGDIYNPSHVRLLRAQFEAYINAYPQTDSFHITFPEHARNSAGYDDAWKSLDKRFGLSSKYDIEEIINDPTSNYLAAGGPSRSVEEAKMTVVMLDALHKLLDMSGVLKEIQKQKKVLGISAGLSCPQLLPVISDALWPDAHITITTGYTASRGTRYLRKLENIDSSHIKVEQVLTLQDDNVGSLPQISSYSTQRLLEFGIEKGWNGYYTRFWPIGDLDPISEYLSHASWRKDVTPDTAYRNYAGRLYGKESEAAVSQALRLQEDATILLDTDHLTLLFPARLIMSWFVGENKKCLMTESLWHIKALFEEVRPILEKLVKDINSKEALSHMMYWISRIDFSDKALSGIAMLDRGNSALNEKNKNAAREYYERAVECFKQALEITAANIRDDSDIGTLAVYYDVLVRETKKRMNEVLA
jgi:hypothetical protein